MAYESIPTRIVRTREVTMPPGMVAKKISMPNNLPIDISQYLRSSSTNVQRTRGVMVKLTPSEHDDLAMLAQDYVRHTGTFVRYLLFLGLYQHCAHNDINFEDLPSVLEEFS